METNASVTNAVTVSAPSTDPFMIKRRLLSLSTRSLNMSRYRG